MASIPVTITEPQMIAVLTGGKRAPILTRLGSGQLVATWDVRGPAPQLAPTGLVVKVYTSIFGQGPPGDHRGISADVGEDSIRICLVDEGNPDAKKGVGKTTYTTRTVGWENRLMAKVREMFEVAYALPTCPACGARMARRKSVHGEFLGCSAYPLCKQTKPLPVPVAK